MASPAAVKDPIALQTELRTIAAEHRRVVSMTPCDLPGAPSDHTHSQRLEWLDSQFLNPIDRILEALDPECRHLLSLWPEEAVDELMPDFDEAKRQLEHLRTLGQNVAINLVQHRYADLPFGQLIRFKVVSAICRVLDVYVPHLRPSRGTYDRTSKQFYGVYPAIVRRIFLEITGLHDQLDRLIKEQVGQRRA